MSGDVNNKKGGLSPSSLESLQLNRSKNKEALEKGLKSRRTVKELVNQGILYNPSVSHPERIKQLQRAKTSDLLKHKIERRPDRQYLISHHILRDKRGTSPHVLEQCHKLAKYHLKESLTKKLISRPGSLELVEKGVLQIDPRVDSFIKHGSISYPRVESVTVASCQDDCLEPTPPSQSTNKLALNLAPNNNALGTTVNKSGSTKSKTVRSSVGRAIRDETVISKLGSLVFHQYCPTSSLATHSTTSSQQKQKAREAQQIQLLRLQDAARAHHMMGKELRDHANVSDESSLSLDVSDHTQRVVTNIRSPEINVSKAFSCYSLAHLTLNQLRSECKERNLVSNGTKIFLMSQLEPYRTELLTKYLSGLKMNAEHNSGCSDASAEDTVNNLAQKSVSVDSTFASSLVNRPLSICGMMPTEQTVSDGIQLYSQFISSSNQSFNNNSTILAAQPFTSLRHSVSTPFFTDAKSHAIPLNLVSTKCNPTMSPLIPITLIDTKNAANVNPFLSVSQTALTQININPEPSFIYLNPSVLTSVQSADNILCSTINNIPVSGDLSMFTNTNKVETTNSTNVDEMVVCGPVDSVDDHSVHTIQSSPNLLNNFQDVNDPHTALDNEIQSILRNSNYLNKRSCHIDLSTDSVPILRQIEETWLRIRQLRKRIIEIRFEEHNSQSPHSDNLNTLEQEHDRLAVLCRLLIIERLDALDEPDCNYSQNFELSGGTHSDVQIEKNLMLSYLRRLSAPTFTNQSLTDDSNDLLQMRSSCQQNSSSDLKTFVFDDYNHHSRSSPNPNGDTNVAGLTRALQTEVGDTSVDCRTVFSSASCSNLLHCVNELNEIVSNEQHEHSVLSESFQLDDNMSTDVFFELWDSVIEGGSSPGNIEREKQLNSVGKKDVHGAMQANLLSDEVSAETCLSTESVDVGKCETDFNAQSSEPNFHLTGDGCNENSGDNSPTHQQFVSSQHVKPKSSHPQINLLKFPDQCSLSTSTLNTDYSSNSELSHTYGTPLMQDMSHSLLFDVQQPTFTQQHNPYTRYIQPSVYSQPVNKSLTNCHIHTSATELSDALFSNFVDPNLVECMDTADPLLLSTPISSTASPFTATPVSVNWTIGT